MRRAMWPGLVWLAAAACVPAMAQGPNLAGNPSFEEDGSGDAVPDGWAWSCNGGSSGGWVTGHARTGQHSVRIEKVRDGQSTVASATQVIAVRPGSEVTLSGWAHGHVKTGAALLFLYMYTAEHEWIGITSPARVVEGDEFEPTAVTLKLDPRCGIVHIRFEIYGLEAEGEAWLDDVTLASTTAPPAAPAGLMAQETPQGLALTWGAATEPVTSYCVYRSVESAVVASPRTRLATTTETALTDAAAPAGGWVYYAVTALGPTLEESAPSATVRVARFGEGITPPASLVWTTSSLQKVRRYSQPPLREASRRLELAAARNENEAGQVVISGVERAVEQATVEAGELRGPEGAVIPASAVKLYRVDYVNVPHPTLPGGQPGLTPDPLPPLEGAFSVPQGANQPVWVSVDVPDGARPGVYRGEIRVQVDGTSTTVPVELKVWDFRVPTASSFGQAFSIWGNFIAPGEGVAEGSEEHRRLVERYFWFLVEHRVLPLQTPYEFGSPEYERLLEDPRMVCFLLPACWEWADNLSPEVWASRISYLREKGWLDRGYSYITDEPWPELYGHCRDLADKIHAAGRDAKMLLTEEPQPELIGAVDIWCPLLANVKPEDIRERQAAGEAYWWYTCCAPQHPYPTYLLDDDAVSTRVLSWAQALYGVEGVLYWGTTYWGNDGKGGIKDLWQNGDVFGGANGDGYLLYPGKHYGVPGPVGSMRLELIRQGNEDFEYLELLRKLLVERDRDGCNARLAEFIGPVCRSLTDFSRDPATLERQRRAVAEAIERLQAEGMR